MIYVVEMPLYGMILIFCLKNFNGCNIGITDGKELCSAPLRWPQAA
jgi:hypothetical protein